MIKAILFDLDGTLLPLDQEVFIKEYFGRLAKKLAPHGYEPKTLIDSIWAGTKAMAKNDGSKTNEEVFWETFCTIHGEKAKEDLPLFDEYYRIDFQNVQASCGFTPKAREIIDFIKNMGYRIALATNPIFPAIATESRIKWAGLTPNDFELYTTYENSTCSKPNPQYYLNIAKHLNVKPEECLMVGNDVSEDMVASEIGMRVFLLKDCIINKNNEDISCYPQGSFDELKNFILNL